MESHWKLQALLPLSFICAFWSSVCADGLPGEYLVSNRWRDLLAEHSALTNPALLGREQFITARGAFSPTMQGAFQLWEAGVTVPLNLTQTAGVALLGENDGSIESSTFDAVSNRLVASGQGSGNSNLFCMLTYAHTFPGKLNAGANLNFAYQSNFGSAIAGIGADLGCTWQLYEGPRAGTHTIGLSTVNLLAPSMGSTLMPRFGYKGEYSRDLRLSWLASYWDNRLESGLDIDCKDIFSKADEFGGAKKPIEWGGSARVGALLLRIIKLYAQLGIDQRVIEYWGLAAGMKVPLGTDGKSVTALYQYNIKTEGTLASSHTLYLIAQFGKSRADQFSSKQSGPKSPPPPKAKDTSRKSKLEDLKKIQGLKIEEEKEFVRITAGEIAVHFESGSAEVPSSAASALRNIAEYLREYPDHPVSIEGHTDSDPITGKLKERYPDNTALSKARAENVKSYFVVTEKLPENLFIIEGFGEGKPVAPNSDQDSKRLNRRVVLTIKK